MFKNMGELAAALEKDRQFEDTDGSVMKFDPLGKEDCSCSPFICKHINSNQWLPMKQCWNEYASVKEILPDLQALRSCVSNYLLGKAWLTNGVVDEILAMDSDSFWIMGSGKKLTLGFSPGKRLGMRFGDFHIRKHGDSYLAFK